MQGFFVVCLAVVVSVLPGCRTPRSGAPEASTVAVRPFEVSRETIVERYSGRRDQIGVRFAELLVEKLNHLGYQAVVVPPDMEAQGDFIVSGRIAEADGGSTAKRVLLGFGAGVSQFDVVGTVQRSDGQVVGEFTESRAGNGWGEQAALEEAMKRSINMIGRMIYTGNYQRNAPKDRPAGAIAAAAPQAAPQPSVEERLRMLDRLRDDGLVTPEEYATKRAAILQDL